MHLEAIDLVAKDGRYFLVDVNTCKPIAVSPEAFGILRAMKRGESREAVGEIHGAETVTAVLDQLGQLQQQGAVGSRKRDFRGETLAIIDRLEAREPAALEGVFMVSQTCNLACRYCYGGDGTFGRRGMMSVETAQRCLRYFLSIHGDNPFQKVVFLGGEPLLNLKVIRHVTDLWEAWRPNYPNRDLYFSMTTNGTLLTPEIARFLKQRKIGVSVSIDGPPDMHDANRPTRRGEGSFDRVMAGIEVLRREDVPFNVRTTMTRQTDVARLHEFFAEHRFDVEYLIPVDFPQETRQADYQLDVEDFRRLTAEQQRLMCAGCQDVETGRADSFNARQLSMAFHNLRNYKSGFPFKCTAGWGILAFDVDGTIYPCQRFVGLPPYAVGDLETGLDRGRVAGFYRRFVDASTACDECWAVHLCRRRCFKQKAQDDGSLVPIPRPVCDVYRDNYAASMVFAEQLQQHARQSGEKLEDVLGRYDTDRLMREHKARERKNEEEAAR